MSLLFSEQCSNQVFYDKNLNTKLAKVNVTMRLMEEIFQFSRSKVELYPSILIDFPSFSHFFSFPLILIAFVVFRIFSAFLSLIAI